MSLSPTFSVAHSELVSSVLLLDEIDEIAARQISVLYNILDWPRRSNSQFIVLGIANTMDLLERLLPRLVSRADIERLAFMPYTHQQIQEVGASFHILSVILFCSLMSVDSCCCHIAVRSRLQDVRAFSRTGLEFCARKIASSSGDVRRALEICRYARSFFLVRIVCVAFDRFFCRFSAASTVEQPNLLNEEHTKAIWRTEHSRQTWKSI